MPDQKEPDFNRYMNDPKYLDEGCDVDPIDWDNYDGQGKSIEEEVQGQRMIIVLLVLPVFVFLCILFLVWLF